MIGFGQLGPYYKGNGHPKAKGLNFQIKTLLGFEQMEGDRPNIVQKWYKNKKDNSKIETCMVLVKNIDKEFVGISREDWKDYLVNQGGAKDIASELDPNAINVKHLIVDNYSGIFFESKLTLDMSERLPFEIPAKDRYITMYMLNVYVFLEKHVYTCQMSVTNKNLLDKKLFFKWVTSTVFSDQWND